MRKDDFTHFTERFKPEQGEDGDVVKYETFGEDYAKAMAQAGDECQFLWTMVEGDNGKWYLVPGFHLVNREKYVICSVPWNEKTRTYLYF